MLVEQLALPPRQLPSPPPYHLPTLLTTFSHMPDRRVEHSDASMAYYRPASIGTTQTNRLTPGADLTYGFELRVEREDLDEHLDALVESLQALGDRNLRGIVTWRGMMTR